MTQFSRTERLIGEKNAQKLYNSRVIVFGLGGVGSYTAEALARSGIGEIALVDFDTVDITNLNRQLYALHSTVGMEKAVVARQRILDINPDCQAQAIVKKYLPENSGEFDLSRYDYIVDAIDNVTAKIDLAVKAEEMNIPIISSMGTGNKLCPEQFEIADIYETSVCPLCRVMRRELKKRQVKSLLVVYSREEPFSDGERTPASAPFVPGAAGLIIASRVVKDLVR